MAFATRENQGGNELAKTLSKLAAISGIIYAALIGKNIGPVRSPNKPMGQPPLPPTTPTLEVDVNKDNLHTPEQVAILIKTLKILLENNLDSQNEAQIIQILENAGLTANDIVFVAQSLEEITKGLFTTTGELALILSGNQDKILKIISFIDQIWDKMDVTVENLNLLEEYTQKNIVNKGDTPKVA